MPKDKTSSKDQNEKSNDEINETTNVSNSFHLERELILVVKDNIALRASKMVISSSIGKDTSELTNLLSREKISIYPLFGLSEEHIKKKVSFLEESTKGSLPDLSIYYRVDAPDERLDELAKKLKEIDIVETSYIKPPAEPSVSLLTLILK